MPTRLLLIRHAHTDPGDPPRLCGMWDAPLSDRGRDKLTELKAGGPPMPAPDALYSSPLRRAADTAWTFAHLWRVVPRIDAALTEIDCGELDGHPIETVQRTHPELWRRNNAQEDDHFTWPGGESYAQFRERIVSALGRICAHHRGSRVAVVTHCGVIAQVLGVLHRRPAAVWEQDRPDVLSVTEVIWANGSPERLVSFNQRWVRGSVGP